MGKHSKEKEKKKINIKKLVIFIFIVIILVFGCNFTQISGEEIIAKIASEKASTEIEEKRLVIKSNSDYNRKIEYTFENNVLKSIKIYEQFEEKEQFETRKNNYEIVNNVEVINVNEQELSLEIKKKDFGSDTGKSYEEIYDKYLVQIIGAYEVVE